MGCHCRLSRHDVSRRGPRLAAPLQVSVFSRDSTAHDVIGRDVSDCDVIGRDVSDCDVIGRQGGDWGSDGLGKNLAKES